LCGAVWPVRIERPEGRTTFGPIRRVESRRCDDRRQLPTTDTTVIAGLGQDTGTGQLGQAGKTGDDRVVGVSAEFFGSSLCEIVGAGSGGVEHRQRDQGLAAHRFSTSSG
jgi:hypothetical protein